MEIGRGWGGVMLSEWGDELPAKHAKERENEGSVVGWSLLFQRGMKKDVKDNKDLKDMNGVGLWSPGDSRGKGGRVKFRRRIRLRIR